MNNTIDRIEAESDMRGLIVSSVSQSYDSSQEYKKHLEIKLGLVYKFDKVDETVGFDKLDSEGLSELKAISLMM